MGGGKHPQSALRCLATGTNKRHSRREAEPQGGGREGGQQGEDLGATKLEANLEAVCRGGHRGWAFAQGGGKGVGEEAWPVAECAPIRPKPALRLDVQIWCFHAFSLALRMVSVVSGISNV